MTRRNVEARDERNLRGRTRPRESKIRSGQRQYRRFKDSFRGMLRCEMANLRVGTKRFVIRAGSSRLAIGYSQMAVMMDPSIVRGVVGSAGLVLVYGYSFWCVFKRNPGNRVIACGSITLMVFVVAMALFRIPHFPIWIVASLFFLVFLLGVLTMGFLVQQGYRALRQRNTL
jgi:hypothetical protein